MEASNGPDPNLASQFALRVALQTMKERCISLQKRLTAVEEENQELREQLETEHTVPTSNAVGVAEIFQLRTQVAELNRQKMQLSEHISMVSTENRKLWSRLSQIAKEQNETSSTSVAHSTNPRTAATKGNDYMSTNNATPTASPRSCSVNQNLIRSKTFTQHSPNPNLRHKIISTATGGGDIEDNSLEEVTLETYPEKLAGAGEDYAVEMATEAELSFTYLNVGASGESGADAELNAEAKKCSEGLEEIRQEALKQRHELNLALTAMETKTALHPCPECEKKKQKPEMADKSLETDESLNVGLASLTVQEHSNKLLDNHNSDSIVAEKHIDIIKEKIQADEVDKICPMCGKLFSSTIVFDDFRAHVETHFIDDSNEVETSIDRNFEYISHAVGDF